jgi:hypothetical protein
MKAGTETVQQLKQLEEAGNDDFELILLAGAEAYEVHELHHFLRRLRLGNMRYRKLRRELFLLACGLPILLAVATVAVAFNTLLITYLSLTLIGISISVLIIGNSQLKNAFRHMPNAHYLRHIIQTELERRRSDAEIY